MNQTLKQKENILLGEFKNRNTKDVYQAVRIEKDKVFFRNYVSNGKDFFISWEDFIKNIVESSKWIKIGFNEDKTYFRCVDCEKIFKVTKETENYIYSLFNGFFYADLCSECFEKEK